MEFIEFLDRTEVEIIKMVEKAGYKTAENTKLAICDPGSGPPKESTGRPPRRHRLLYTRRRRQWRMKVSKNVP